VNVLVIPIKDHIGGSQESVTENREVIVFRNTKLADA
jgi:hypothetical protein